MKPFHLLVAGAALCGACPPATAQGNNDALCQALGQLAEGLAVDETRSLELEATFDSAPFGSKTCKPSPMDAKGMAICRSVMKNSSTEFMGHNIARVLACVTGKPPLTGKGIHLGSLSGKLTVYALKAYTEIDYQFNSPHDQRNFVAVRITGWHGDED
jgi:hypothetical protein